MLQLRRGREALVAMHEAMQQCSKPAVQPRWRSSLTCMLPSMASRICCTLETRRCLFVQVHRNCVNADAPASAAQPLPTPQVATRDQPLQTASPALPAPEEEQRAAGSDAKKVKSVGVRSVGTRADGGTQSRPPSLAARSETAPNGAEIEGTGGGGCRWVEGGDGAMFEVPEMKMEQEEGAGGSDNLTAMLLGLEAAGGREVLGSTNSLVNASGTGMADLDIYLQEDGSSDGWSLLGKEIGWTGGGSVAGLSDGGQATTPLWLRWRDEQLEAIFNELKDDGGKVGLIEVITDACQRNSSRWSVFCTGKGMRTQT